MAEAKAATLFYLTVPAAEITLFYTGDPAAITSQRAKANLPTHIMLEAENTGLARDSIVLLEQIRTIDKHRLKERSKADQCRGNFTTERYAH